MNNFLELESTRKPNSGQCGEQIQCESSRKWIPVVNNHNRRPQNSVQHLAKQDNSCIPTYNKYMLLKILMTQQGLNSVMQQLKIGNLQL